MRSPWMDPRSLGPILLLIFALANAAPQPHSSWDKALDDYPEDGCYYQYQYYEEGEQIRTSEPCLNCTCHNQMLMCYLRVCPFIKPVGKNCVVEKREDQCCPTIMCPEVPVTLVTSTTTSTTSAPMIASSAESTSIQLAGSTTAEPGCHIDGQFYMDGMQVPRDPERPCELCYCIKNSTACVMQECTLKMDGCKPIYQDGVCCPVKYMCDDGIAIPGLFDHSRLTTESPTTPAIVQNGCMQNGLFYADGASIESEDPCEHCYCMKGDIVCAVEPCMGGSMEGESDSCVAVPPPPGECCPVEYKCESNALAQTKPPPLTEEVDQKIDDVQYDDAEMDEEKPDVVEKIAEEDKLELPSDVEEAKDELPAELEEEKEDLPAELDEEKQELPAVIEEEKVELPDEVIDEKQELPEVMDEEKQELPAEVEDEKQELPLEIDEEKEELPSVIDEEKEELPTEVDEKATELASEEELPLEVEEEKVELPTEIEEEKQELPLEIEEEKEELPSEIEEEKQELPAEIEEDKEELPLEIEEEKQELPSVIEEEKQELPAEIEGEQQELPAEIEEEKQELPLEIEEETQELPAVDDEVLDEKKQEVTADEEKEQLPAVIEEDKQELPLEINEDKEMLPDPEEQVQVDKEEQEVVEKTAEEEKQELPIETEMLVEEDKVALPLAVDEEEKQELPIEDEILDDDTDYEETPEELPVEQLPMEIEEEKQELPLETVEETPELPAPVEEEKQELPAEVEETGVEEEVTTLPPVEVVEEVSEDTSVVSEAPVEEVSEEAPVVSEAPIEEVSEEAPVVSEAPVEETEDLSEATEAAIEEVATEAPAVEEQVPETTVAPVEVVPEVVDELPDEAEIEEMPTTQQVIEEVAETTVASVPDVIEEQVVQTTSVPAIEETSEDIMTTTAPEQPIETEMTTQEEPEEAVIETTMAPSVEFKKCFQDGVEYEHLADVQTDDACNLCQCDNGQVICAQQQCAGPPEGYENCAPVKVDGECCPQYECDDNSNTRLEGDEDYEITTIREPKPLESDEIVPKFGTKDEEELPSDEENEIFDDDSEYVIDDRCYENGVFYSNNEEIPHSNPCKLCMCAGGTVICADRECLVPKGYENCVPLPTTECCPEQFECAKPSTDGQEEEEVETTTMLVTIAPTEEAMTTLPPDSGSCLIDGIAYMNASSVPTDDKCMDSCSCVEGEITCQRVECPESHLEPGMVCKEFYVEGECCPSHNCVNEEDEDVDLESESHMITTMAPDTDEESETEIPEVIEESIDTDEVEEESEMTTDVPSEEEEMEMTTMAAEVDEIEEVIETTVASVEEEFESVSEESEEVSTEEAESAEETEVMTDAPEVEIVTEAPEEDIETEAPEVATEVEELAVASTEAPEETEMEVMTEAPEETAETEAPEAITEASEVVETEAPEVEVATDAPEILEEEEEEAVTDAPEVVTDEPEVETMTDAPETVEEVMTDKPEEVVETEAPEVEVITDAPEVPEVVETEAPEVEMVTDAPEVIEEVETTMAPESEEVPSEETEVTETEAPEVPIETTEAPTEEEAQETTAAPEILETAAPIVETTTTTTTTEAVPEGACVVDGAIIQDGSTVPSSNPCEFCQCFSGEVICPVQECPPAPAGCTALPVKAGACCPEYECPVEDEILDDDTDVPEDDTNAILQKGSNAPTYPPDFTDDVRSDLSSTESAVIGTASSDILDTSSSTTVAPTSDYEGEYEYEDELTLDSIGPGACLFEGKVYVSAQQIPRTNPCDFCFCFRGDIICLQQSCPPPIPGCREEAIGGFCCPRYECPVKAGVQNVTVPAPPNEPSLASWLFGSDQEPEQPGEITQQISGCEVQGRFYEVGAIVESSSGPCLQCRCGFDEKLECEPLACEPQPMMAKMLAIRR